MTRRLPPDLLTVPQAAEALDVSESTVWRMLRAGSLASVTKSGRRLVPRRSVERRAREVSSPKLRPLTTEHPLWRLVGAAKSGGRRPDSSDKYGVLAGE